MNQQNIKGMGGGTKLVTLSVTNKKIAFILQIHQPSLMVLQLKHVMLAVSLISPLNPKVGYEAIIIWCQKIRMISKYFFYLQS